MCILMPLPVGRTLCVYGHILIYTQACISDREGRLCLCSFDALPVRYAIHIQCISDREGRLCLCSFDALPVRYAIPIQCISDREGRLCLCSFDALLRREFSGDAAYQAARRVFPPVAADSEVCCALCAVLVVDLCAGGSGQPICGLPIWEGAV